MKYLARIADRVLGRPLLIHPGKAELIASVLGERIGIDIEVDTEAIDARLTELQADRPAANRLVGDPAGTRDDRGRLVEYLYNQQGGVAVIPVTGTLVNRGAYVGESSGFQSYEGLSYQLMAAAKDPAIRAILLDMDSPGGEATGMFALAETIRAVRAQKPVTALVDDMAASAAYGLAAQANEIVVSPTSITGSIGVVLMHIDRSGEMAKRGRNVTLIHAGAKKVDGNPYGPLTDKVRADLQRDVDTFYERFVETVAAGRPKLSAEAIRATEADTYIGRDAIEVGLADRLGTFAATLERLSQRAAEPRPSNGGVPVMTTTTEAIGTLQPDAGAVESARAEGENAAKARIQAILNSEHAKGRAQLANHLAFSTSMPAKDAIALLELAPAAQPARTVPSLEERGHQGVTAGNAGPVRDFSAMWEKAMAKASGRPVGTA